MKTKTSQFRIPHQTKHLFSQICAYRNVSMTSTLIGIMEKYITEQTKDPSLMRHLRNQETTRQTGLVQDENKTWVKPEQFTEEESWRKQLL